MNQLQGEITSVETQGALSLVGIQLGEELFKSIVVETPSEDNYLHKGTKVGVLFKETEVVLAKDPKASISMQNRLICHIKSIEKGKLLSQINLQHPLGEISSIVTSKAVEQLELKPGGSITAMIKTNEIMLSHD